MHIIWTWIHPMRALVLLHIFLAVLAFTIHFILLSTERYNWLKGPAGTVQRKADLTTPTKPVVPATIFKV